LGRTRVQGANFEQHLQVVTAKLISFISGGFHPIRQKLHFTFIFTNNAYPIKRQQTSCGHCGRLFLHTAQAIYQNQSKVVTVQVTGNREEQKEMFLSQVVTSSASYSSFLSVETLTLTDST
jgi:hypothetical protein